MKVTESLRKAANHGVNYFFGHRPGTTRAKPATAAMPPAGSDHPPRTSPAPNEAIVLRQGGQIQSQYGILGPNEGTGPGPAAGTDFATPEQNTAAREGFQPVSNPPGISTVSTTDWFGPLQPLRPAAPQGTEPRRFEYVLGQNIIFEPRANEAVSYATLRAMADATDLMRMVIETVKNEMKRSAWEINAPVKIGETRGQRKKREEADPVIGEIKRLLRHPDGIHPWETFVGEIMEDMLVIDAPSILLRRSPDGKKVTNLIPVNGATITRYINTSGLTPVYDPDCSHPGHSQLGKKQPVKGAQVCDCAAYAQYLYGVNAINLTTRDLIYMPYNMRTHKLYGYSPVEQIVVAINLYLRREMALLSYYTEGNIPEMIGFLPNTVTTEQVKEFEQWFNSVNRGDPAFMRRVRFVPNPSPTGDPKFVELKQHLLAEGIDEWLIRMIAYAFNVPPTQLVRMHARAATESMSEESQITGLEAYQKWFEAMLNHIIECQMGHVGYRFKFRPVREADLLKQRQADQLMAKSGGMTLNEWREAEGFEPYNSEQVPDADKPLIFTPQGYVVVGEGGALVQPETSKPSNGNGLAKPNTRANPNNQGSSAHQSESPPLGKFDFPTLAVAGPAPHAAEARMRESLMRIFGQQKLAVRNVLSNLGKAEDDDLEKKLWLAVAAYYALLPGATEAALRQAAFDAAVEAAGQAGTAPAPAVQSISAAESYARARAAEMVGMRRTAGGTLVENPDARWVISETTRNEIRQAVEDAIAGKLRAPSGEALPLAESIRKSLLDAPGGPFSDYRAGMIARAEIKNARSHGKMETWKRIGVKATTWRTTGDSRVCLMCAMNEGVTRPIGEPFPSGFVSIADSHPNCRCVQVPEGIEKALQKSTLSVPRSWRAYFMRHGETEANEEDLARGWGKWPLTPAGKKQAETGANFLVGHGITRIVASDLPRAKETAQIAAKILRVPVEYARELRSLNVGEFTGKSKKQTRDSFIAYVKDPKLKIPGGETVAGFIKRAVKFVLKMVAKENDEMILFVLHSSDLGALWYSFNRASLLHLADNEVVEPGGVAELKNGRIVPIFKPAPSGRGEME